MFMLFSSC
ncbi:hypothetical protein KM1_303840 [Entamoeba histolytica HM-3:IMSS]|uniref:Uncharacterized protein n=1 Tax=Entamoeba histolytica HM-3:IMSS TaxID=885315 RepID=M7WSP2_ENTHI|nr:hypothetical protein KM1_303840 [Entamoeba histolytica HM-3:IMSS]